MNLAATVGLYAGGAGSGCNPAVAKPRCGRPKRGGVRISLRKSWFIDDDDYVRLHEGRYRTKVLPTRRIDLGEAGRGIIGGLIVDYADTLRRGEDLPRIKVVPVSGGRYEIVDGTHRFLAWRRLRQKQIPVLVIQDLE